MPAKLIPFRMREGRLPWEEARQAAQKVLALSPGEWTRSPSQYHLEDPEVLLCVSEILRQRHETSPSNVRDHAECFFRFLSETKVQIGLFDERDYFLGEFALIAGTASRFLFHRDEACRWFDRAESKFVLTANNASHVARLAYQRLALRLEQRQFEEVLELAPHWFQVF